MADWRSKPRTGKAQFVKHLAVIQARLNAGETQTTIRQALSQGGDFEMSAAQFSRYIKAFGLTASVQMPARAHGGNRTAPAAEQPGERPQQAAMSAVEAPSAPKAPLTQADFRKIREDVNKMDLNALISGKGIVYAEK